MTTLLTWGMADLRAFGRTAKRLASGPAFAGHMSHERFPTIPRSERPCANGSLRWHRLLFQQSRKPFPVRCQSRRRGASPELSAVALSPQSQHFPHYSASAGEE